ncbi:hypothetical protein MDAP_002096 [Mitosporidium daphniae]|uniref:ubiquitinyl hydrolase 1 n=1 Tax=Mitosporidium daphniae TaxID=1485682 RepID=A0A098VNG8_9MICR|nr:uncharacterized protein DI09_61p90 [Mitosporidium daphniae]KGG50622.1 hypothetical protein DI09_61p90 [Mitosporidium daphniae]|eukprot:XP_013237067.1 uncharacterized protein DI09_61p90 [Mitosporidium daphniae]
MENIVPVYVTELTEAMSLSEILEQGILKPSVASLDGAWRCDKCGAHGCGYRYTKFLRPLGKGLIVHINRIYQFERKSDQKIKISKKIHVRNSVLSLRAVVEHIGNSLGGHYICYRRLANGRWAMTSDATVKYMRGPPSSLEPYLLLYEPVA